MEIQNNILLIEKVLDFSWHNALLIKTGCVFSLASYMNYSLNKSICHHINKHSDISLGLIALFNDSFLPFFVRSMLRICETMILI